MSIKTRFLIVFSLFLIIITPFSASAEIFSKADKMAMLYQIKVLQEQVAVLNERLALMNGGAKARVASEEITIYPSRFYTGAYEALYRVPGTEIVRRDNSVTRVGDQLLWNTYVNLVGQTFVGKYISEFRVFNDESNILTGYVEQKPDGTWIIAMNRHGDDLSLIHDDDSTIELLLHESGHIIFFVEPKYQENFDSTFWSSYNMIRHAEKMVRVPSIAGKVESVASFYEQNSNNFVTDYAATSPVEDLIESFVSFVLEDKTYNENISDQKVNFFYKYPELVSWRKQLRSNIF